MSQTSCYLPPENGAEGFVLHSRDLQRSPSAHPCWAVPWELSTRAAVGTVQCPCQLLLSSAELSVPHEKAAA